MLHVQLRLGDVAQRRLDFLQQILAVPDDGLQTLGRLLVLLFEYPQALELEFLVFRIGQTRESSAYLQFRRIFFARQGLYQRVNVLRASGYQSCKQLNVVFLGLLLLRRLRTAAVEIWKFTGRGELLKYAYAVTKVFGLLKIYRNYLGELVHCSLAYLVYAVL